MTAGRLTGDEPFTRIDATVRDFWAYMLSDLLENDVRGYLAEFLVAKAVGATGPRVGWDAYDVQAPDGTTIEVKTTGYSQTWERTGPAVLTFAGLPGKPSKQSWYAATNTYGPAHVAEAYVFAVHMTQPGDPYDALDIDAWRFHVLPGAVVAGTGQGSMRLSTVRRLGGVEVEWGDLGRAISEAATTHAVLKGSGDEAGGRAIMSEERCIHDMAPGTCADCHPRDPARLDLDTSVVWVSPARYGHIWGACPHKPEGDDDYEAWGTVTLENAWQDLCNGTTLTTNDGPRIGIVATRACGTCRARV